MHATPETPETSEQHTKPCVVCDTGTVRPTPLNGQRFDYRDEVGLVFDEELVVPRCDACGELYLKGELTERFSAALERLRLAHKRRAGERFVDRLDRDYAHVPRALWEDTLGLSRGYLSRVAHGKRVPDTVLEIFLEAFARDPQTALRLLEVAGHLRPELSEALARR